MTTVWQFIDDCIDAVVLDYDDRISLVLGSYLRDYFQRQDLVEEKNLYVSRLLAVKSQFLITDLMQFEDDTIYQDIYV